MGQRRQVEQHGDATAGIGRQFQRLDDECIAETPAIGRIGDNVFCAWFGLPQEIHVALAIAARLNLTFEYRATGYGDLGTSLVRFAAQEQGIVWQR